VVGLEAAGVEGGEAGGAAAVVHREGLYGGVVYGVWLALRGVVLLRFEVLRAGMAARDVRGEGWRLRGYSARTMEG
jgi:hypothetical protein